MTNTAIQSIKTLERTLPEKPIRVDVTLLHIHSELRFDPRRLGLTYRLRDGIDIPIRNCAALRRGMPIRVNGQVVGAVGVASLSKETDAAIANAATAALTPRPSRLTLGDGVIVRAGLSAR